MYVSKVKINTHAREKDAECRDILEGIVQSLNFQMTNNNYKGSFSKIMKCYVHTGLKLCTLDLT